MSKSYSKLFHDHTYPDDINGIKQVAQLSQRGHAAGWSVLAKVEYDILQAL